METPRDERIVLVIDDDAAVLASLKFSLEVEGYAVIATSRGAEALADVSLPRAGCLVVDFDLPDFDGLAVLDGFRRRGIDWPAILIASDPTPTILRRADAFGVTVIEKPLFGNALLDAIRAAFSA